MTAANTADDDTAAFIPSANGNPSNALPTGSITDELLSKVLPRVDTVAAETARVAVGKESKDSSEDHVRPDLHRSFLESSISIDHGAFKDQLNTSKDLPLESKDGRNMPRLRKASGSVRDSLDLRRPFSPLSQVDMVPQGYSPDSHNRSDRESLAVPKRRSSRPDRAFDSPDQTSRQRINTLERFSRAEKVEAARRHLGFEPDEYSIGDEKREPARGFSTATPPPIGGRPRVIIYDDSEEEGENADDLSDETDHDYHEYRNKYHDEKRDIATTPVTAIYQPSESTPRPSTAHHRYTRDYPSTLRASSRQSPQPPLRSRAAEPLAAHKKVLRIPVLDHNWLYQDAEPPAISQRRPRNPRPRRTTYKELSYMEEEALRDYSFKNGLDATLTPDYRPAKTEMGAMSDDSLSMSRQSTSKHSMTSNGSSRGADFFGPGIFQTVLHNPITVHQLLKFAEARFCSEGVELLKKVEQYQTVLNDLAGIMTTIHKDFLSDDSAKQINVNGELRKSVHSDMKSLVTKTLPSMETLFADLQESVEQDVFLDIYPRFVRHQMTLSATRALATNRHSYQGLGDCFCLTNPGLADNPIVFASDGFIKVTGYTRPEIIPRNCRFLQGAHTDREPVRRLKTAIDERKESVELILNYKKNGDPFWNLLYVAPLYNEEGKLAFFLGGQINCSTTIHSNADVMKVLSASSNDHVEDVVKTSSLMQRSASAPSARKVLLKALGIKVDDNGLSSSDIEPGMESKLLHKLEGRDLKAQMKEFYTAYSKYLVVNHDSFVIGFYSEGVLEMLHPANNTVGLVAGQDVFRFLKQNMLNQQTDYKTRVRNGMRAGVPVSVEVRLQTRRSALFRGDEKFMTHWTPLKDEKSAVHWIVVTMAPTIQ